VEKAQPGMEAGDHRRRAVMREPNWDEVFGGAGKGLGTPRLGLSSSDPAARQASADTVEAPVEKPRYAPAPTTAEGAQARLAEVQSAEGEIRAWAESKRLKKPGARPSAATVPQQQAATPAKEPDWDAIYGPAKVEKVEPEKPGLMSRAGKWVKELGGPVQPLPGTGTADALNPGSTIDEHPERQGLSQVVASPRGLSPEAQLREDYAQMPEAQRLSDLRLMAKQDGEQGRKARALLKEVEQENAAGRDVAALRPEFTRIMMDAEQSSGSGAQQRPTPMPEVGGLSQVARIEDDATTARRSKAEQALRRAEQSPENFADRTERAASLQPRTAKELGQDLGVALKQGVVMTQQVVANSIDPSGEWAKSLNAEMRGLDKELTPQAARQAKELAGRLASSDGELAKFGTMIAELVTDPTLMLRELARQAPIMAGIITATVAGGVGGGVVARGAATVLPRSLGVAEAISPGMVIGAGRMAGATVTGAAARAAAAGGDAAGQVFEYLSDKTKVPDALLLRNPDVRALIKEGKSIDEAREIVATAKARIGQALGSMAGVVFGGMGLDALIAKRLGGDAAKRGAIATVAKEAGGEVAEEVSTQVAGNVGIRVVDPSRTLTEGTGEAGALALATSIPMSVGGAALARQDLVREFLTPSPPNTTSPTEFQAASLKRFDELASAFGLNPKAAKAVREQAGAMPSGDTPGFIAKAVKALNARSLFKRPVDDAGVAELQGTLTPEPPTPAEQDAPPAANPAPGAGLADEDYTGLAGPRESDLTTIDGHPYGTKSGATARANKVDGEVVEVPGGFVVRPKEQDGADPAGAGGSQPADAGRGAGAELVPDQRPADVLASPADPARQGVDVAGADGDGRDAAPGALRKIGSYGRTPKATQDITLKPNEDGTLTPYEGKYPMVEYESGEQIRLPADVTDAQAADAIRAAGAITSRDRFYGVKPDAKPAQQDRPASGPVQPAADSKARADLDAALGDLGSILGARQAETSPPAEGAGASNEGQGQEGRRRETRLLNDQAQAQAGTPAQGTGATRSTPAPTRVAARLTPLEDDRLKADEHRQALEGARADIGWVQRGGTLMRDPRTAIDPDSPDAHREGDVVGRTPWIGSDLWRHRPDAGGKVTEAEARLAIDKALAGEPMTARQKRFVQYVLNSEADREVARKEDAARMAEADNEERRASLTEQERAEEDAEREAIMAEAGMSPSQLRSITDEDIPLEIGPTTQEAALRAVDFTDEDINAELQSAAQDAADGAAEDRATQALASAERQARAPDGVGSEPARDRPQDGQEEGLTLTAQSEQDLRDKAAREEAAAQAERDRQAELAARDAKAKRERDKAEKDARAAQVLAEREAAKKREIDAAAETFELGQEPPKPVDRKVSTEQARGQGDVFDAPAAPPARQLTDDEAFSDNFARFDGKPLAQTVTVADTGQTATLKMDAAKAMRAQQARLDALKALRTCLGA